MVDGCQSKLVNVVSGVHRAVFGTRYCFSCRHRNYFSFWRISWSLMPKTRHCIYMCVCVCLCVWRFQINHLIAIVPSPGVRVTVAESLSRDLVKVSEWCDHWDMKLYTSETKAIIVSRSLSMHPRSPALTIGRTVLKESDDLVILGVTFSSKMTFEQHLRSVSRAASQRLGILRKSLWVFHDRLLLGRCFRDFVLPVLEYCSVVRCSAADKHLKLLDRVVSGASFLTSGVFEGDLAYRRSVYYVCSTRSGVTRRALNMVLYLCRTCRCGLHAELRYIYVLPRGRTSQYRGPATIILLPCQCLCGPILVT